MTTGPDTVSDRQLNRWTLARQHLLERAPLGAVEGVEALAGMQAQQPSSPYIGLWSRLAGFERAHLEDALRSDLVVKASVMRGTLHLVAARQLACYRIGAGSSSYDAAIRRLSETGADLTAIRAKVVAEVGRRPHTRTEVSRLVTALVGSDLPGWLADRPWAMAAVAIMTDLVNVAEDAAFGYLGGSRYRAAPATTVPLEAVDPRSALRFVARAYLAAYGPATPRDLGQWSGRPVRDFAAALAGLDLVRFRAQDGRTLLDLPDAPRPPGDVPAPVRFLPRWDNLLLAYARRERVLPEPYRRLVIANNGDVSPTFLVDGRVAGTWEAALRGPAVVTLRELAPLATRAKRSVQAEGARLLAWLRPGEATAELRWA